MWKIITALGNPKINEKINKFENKNYEIIYQDIQYQDGVLEILERENNIDFLILSEILEGEYNIYEFINKIKEKNNFLGIIIILEKENNNLKNFLNANGIFNIFYNNKSTFEELIKLINKNNNKLNKEEINKEIIFKNNNNNKLNYFKKNTIQKIKNKLIVNKKHTNNYKKIISVVGSGGVGKSSFCYIISKIIINKKILIIDFDILNSSINSIFNIKKLPEKAKVKNIIKEKIKINDLIIRADRKINILCGTEILIDDDYKMKTEKFSSIINMLLTQYDLIIIDTSSECFLKYTKEILKKSDLILFITEPNLLELKKSKNLLNIYLNKWKIKKEKINIIFNKTNINSINKNILNNLFSDFNILGEIKLNINYNIIINKNIKIINKKIKKDYLNIINKLNLNKK